MPKHVFKDGYGNELSPGFYTLKQVGLSMNAFYYIHENKEGDQEAMRIVQHGSKDYSVQIFKPTEGIVNICPQPLKRLEKETILDYIEWKKRSVDNLERWLESIDLLEE